METLFTERLIIRNFKKEDYNDLFAYLSLPEVFRFESGGTSDLLTCKNKAKLWSGQDICLGVVLKQEQKLIGHLYFNQIDPKQINTWELGFMFHPQHQGKGYAVESGMKLVDYAFSQLHIHRVVANCQQRNVASWKLLERLGMRREGIFTKNIFFHEDKEGQPIWIDSFSYGILQEEWISRTNN